MSFCITMMKKSRIKNAILHLTLVFISLFSMFIVSESLLWLIKPHLAYQNMPQIIKEGFYENSDHAEFTLKKNYRGRFLMSEAYFDSIVETNSLGWRDIEPDSRPRILIFGDSFVFGFGLNNGETISDHLEYLSLNSINFVNLGYTAGRSPDSYAIYLKYNTFLHNEYVIILICSNDLEDIKSNYYVNKFDKEVSFQSNECFKIRNKSALIRKGRFFADRTFVTQKLPIWLIELMKRSYLVGLLRDRLPNLKNKSIKAETEPADRAHERSLQILLGSLGVVRNLSKNLIIFTVDDTEKNPCPVFQKIEIYCKKHGIKYYSIPKLDSSYYWKRDAHYNQKGAQWAANFIYSKLS